jgi:hypothetical protein
MPNQRFELHRVTRTIKHTHRLNKKGTPLVHEANNFIDAFFFNFSLKQCRAAYYFFLGQKLERRIKKSLFSLQWRFSWER